MIIDSHAHIFPDAVIRNRADYFSDEPAFKLLYESPDSKLISADDLIATMDEEGVDISVVFGFPWTDSDTFKANNDAVIEAVQKYPDRLVGMACFDVSNTDCIEEVERCIAAGLKGAGELAFYQSGIDDTALAMLDPIMDICRDHDHPVMIHTNEPVGHLYPGKTPITLAQIYRLAETFPRNKIILAHWGGGIFFYNQLKKDARRVLENIYYDTAASPYLYTPEIYTTAVRLAGADKIILGSDYPLLKPSRYFRDMEKAGISEEERTAICGDSAAALFKLNNKISQLASGSPPGALRGLSEGPAGGQTFKKFDK